MKNCCNCKVEKELVEFGNDKTRKDGLNRQCKLCNKSMSKSYYESNKDKLNVKMKTYREANKDKRKAQKKSWDESNKDKIKAYREANKDKIKAYQKAYREAKKKRLLENS